jgi:hypothetical protein
MPQIMKTRSMTIGSTAHTDLAGRGIERPVNLCVIQPIAPAGDEQISGHGPVCPMALASSDVVCEDFAGRSMQGHQSILTQLGAADRQHTSLQIDILKPEITCFTQP